MAELYFDHAATTPLDGLVLDAMLPYLRERFGNASSTHRKGIEADQALGQARRQVAQLVGAEPGQIIFTSGGSEANALGILGSLARGAGAVASAIEHPSALECARMRAGPTLRIAPIGPEGRVDVDAFVASCDATVAVATCMLVSHELGTVQPVAELAGALRRRGFAGHFHVDCVQALGRIPIRLEALGADSIALSAHKIGGPKGAGALVIRSGVRLRPLWGGGKQEGGLRPGTENVPAWVGFGRAAELAGASLGDGTWDRIAALRASLAQALVGSVPNVQELAADSPRAPHILSVVVPRTKAEVVVHAAEVRGLYVSAGSACSSRDRKPSRVMRALGRSESDELIRFSLGARTNSDEIAQAAAILAEAIEQVRL